MFVYKIMTYFGTRRINKKIPPQLLPVPVDPLEAEEMFDFADKDQDSRIGWHEFQVAKLKYKTNKKYNKNTIKKLIKNRQNWA